jgi:hypothetical protein
VCCDVDRDGLIDVSRIDPRLDLVVKRDAPCLRPDVQLKAHRRAFPADRQQMFHLFVAGPVSRSACRDVSG